MNPSRSARVQARTFVDLLSRQVEGFGQLPVLTFLTDGDGASEVSLSFAMLDRRARAVAVELQARTSPGDRVLLLYPPGLDFVIGFFGCLYAGVVAVPAYPPDPGRLQRTLPRLTAIVEDAQARLALTTLEISAVVEGVAAMTPALAGLSWLASDAVTADPGDWREPKIGGETPAFLQYTSGSTGTPKGVVLTHGNLLANSEVIARSFEHGEGSRGVIWLPQYHDMGLIGGILQPLYVGFPVVLMSPLHFLRRPARWLRAISRTGATTSGGPNFAYDLCVRKVSPEERATLDLSSWDLAFCGAEPIQAATLRRFADAFAPAGFRMESFFPCYGLAEGTLIVSGGPKGKTPTLLHADPKALEADRLVPSEEGEARVLVGCGNLPEGTRVAIVDPQRGTGKPDGEVGELWVSSASVAQGYFQRAEPTAATFGARLADGSGPFLRTGDLGAMVAGELFVTGRVDDLIILHGQNHYPQDLEHTIEASSPSVRRGCTAVFTVDRDGDRRLVAVAEVERRHADRRRVDARPASEQRSSGPGLRIEVRDPSDQAPAPVPFSAEEVFRAVRAAVSRHHALQLGAVVLIQQGSIPKTSSGKIQRRACRADYLAGRLEVVGVEDWLARP